MDDLGKMLGGFTDTSGAGGGGGDLVGALGGLVGGEGGLEGLIGQLQAGGLGDQVGSWVGTGPNKAVDPEALHQALGDDKVHALAAQTGLPIGQLLPMLASLLPTIVDALTPGGNVPKGDASANIDIGGLLEGLAGAAGQGQGGPLGGLGDLLGGLTGGDKAG